MFGKVWRFLNDDPEFKLLEPLSDALTSFIDGKILKAIYQGIIGLIQFLQRIILTTPSDYMKTSAFWEIYRIMMMLSLAVIFIVILVLAFLKLSGYKLETAINKLIPFPVLAIVAPYVLLRFVDIFNRITRLIINTDGIVIPEVTTGGSIAGILLFMAAFAILSIKLIFFYAKRMIKIILFAVLFPVIYAFWVLPFYNSINRWVDEIFTLLFSQVIHALILLILGTVIMGASEINNTMTIVYQVGALGVMNEVEGMINNFFGTERLNPDISRRGYYKAKANFNQGKKIYEGGKKIAKKIFTRYFG